MEQQIILAGIVPAAGASTRMGADKRRLPLPSGLTVLEQTVSCLRAGGVAPIIVVLEPDSPCAALAGLADTSVVTNPAPARGMLSSIRAGLEQLPRGAAAAAILPGDHPFVPPSAIRSLVERFTRLRPLLLAPRFAGRQGHPLLLGRPLFDEAMACDDAVGLRQLVRRHAADLVLLDLPHEGAEQDLDTPADLERLKR